MTADPGIQPIDLLLQQGTREELQALRTQVAEDPMLALEVAETVALVGRLRDLRVEPSPAFAGAMLDICRQAQVRVAPPARPRLLPWWSTIAAAAAVFALLAFCDPLGLRRVPPRTCDLAATAAVAPAAGAVSPLPPTPGELARQEAVELMRQRFTLENSESLQGALALALEEPRDPLRAWIAASNSLAVLRLDYQLRSSPSVRANALRAEGAMLAADARVQRLADELATELPRLLLDPKAEVGDVARGLRALVAAGEGSGDREQAVALACRWLDQRLPETAGADRVLALAALLDGEAAGHPCFAIAAVGARLVDDIVLADDETWRRRRPELLSPYMAAGAIGEAGRIVGLLPAFGVDAAACRLARQLLLGSLGERRCAEQDRPEVLAAIVYGFRDLLSGAEADALVHGLQRWKAARLAPDFDTVQQLAWGVEPGQLGFTRLQRDLRQLVILPTPRTLAARAAFCLCIASSFAAYRSTSLERFAAGE